MVNTTYELKVKKIEKKVVSTENMDEDTHFVLKAEDSNNGIPKITVTSESPFIGIKPKMTITVTLTNPQTTLKEIDPIQEAVAKTRKKKEK